MACKNVKCTSNFWTDLNEDIDDTVLKKGEFVASLGTNGLSLNILQITKDYQQDSTTPKTRIRKIF